VESERRSHRDYERVSVTKACSSAMWVRIGGPTGGGVTHAGGGDERLACCAADRQ
jgi:hypothetical protein